MAGARVWGGLVQLIACGPFDYLTGPGVSADLPAYNTRASVMHWFVDRADGQATRDDVVPDRAWSVLTHVPAALKPGPFSLEPFSVGRERAACAIQREWRRAIADPGRRLCRDRLQREFAEMA